MRWPTDLLTHTIFVSFGQNPPGSGSLLEPGSWADWANVTVAFLSMAVALVSLWFAIHTYRQQQEMNRLNLDVQREKDQRAEQQQHERDQAAKLELERVRQQTIRLAWYRDVVKPRLDVSYQAFAKFRNVRAEVGMPLDLTDNQRKILSKSYRQVVAELRNQLLDYIVQIHTPTNRKLLAELDNLVVDIDKALFNSKLKLSHDEVYEDEIGKHIATCQERFFQTLYAYQGDENPEQAIASS